MPAVTRRGDRDTGHDACPPRPLVEGEPTVTVAGQPLARVGHRYAPHGCPDHAPHDATLAAGASHASLTGRAIGRVGDPVSCGGTVMEGCPTVAVGDNGGADFAREQALSLVHDPVGQTIRCIPEIAAAEAERAGDPDDAQGWRYLHDMFIRWFTGRANAVAAQNPDYFVVDWDWIMRYQSPRMAYDALTDLAPLKNSIYNDMARRQLAEYLRADGKLTDQRETFDYINAPKKSTADQKGWEDRYFQQHPVPRSNRVDGLLAAMGGFSMCALAKGEVAPNPRGGHTVFVVEVAVFVYDKFDFDPDDYFFFWDCGGKAFSFSSLSNRFLMGKDLIQFRAQYGIGNDFQVFSAVHKVEDFEEMKYDEP